ncbi:hypothetical protein [Cupriavidus sp. UME77]|uniref:hypothetical protein n=1 Tax=Cupriavidus sp. UME77 TaxID=1862321 RepID=UPI001601DB49|nr:hypothetical protein [Cupriavidus sp. UME77]MBB1635013.1 hypothetical protein [Cupriavidus sp. UME77]
MVGQSTVAKRLYAKRGEFLQKPAKKSAQRAVADALQALSKIGDRKEKSGENGDYVRAVIYHRAYTDMHFGIFASYEKGTHQLVVAEDDSAEMLTVEQVAPPDSADKTKRNEFLEGICYFGLFKNHILVVQSSALRVKQLEAHLNWLLQRGQAISNNDNLILGDQVSKATRDKIRKAHVKELEFGTPLVNVTEVTDPQVTQQAGVRTSVMEYAGLGIDILRQAIGAERLDKLHLADAIDGNLEVTIRVRYKRKTTERGHKLLDNIAIAARHMDEDDVTNFSESIVRPQRIGTPAGERTT